jgi:glucose/mannose-6-phosphate isomerase
VGLMDGMSLELGPRVPVKRNEAKQLVSFLFGKLPVLYAGQDHLEAVASRWKGQLNENAKQLALVNVLPEMNHNEVEGYAQAETLSRRMAVVFLRHPQGDHPRVKRRFDVLKPLLTRRTAGVREVCARGRSVLAQMLTTLYLGDLVSVYLAYLKRVDPSEMTVIDKIKKALAGR